MAPEDYVDIEGLRNFQPAGDADSNTSERPRKFLSVWFQCCHTYGRMYRNHEGTKYEGRCPRCGAAVLARIGPHGSTRNLFEAK